MKGPREPKVWVGTIGQLAKRFGVSTSAARRLVIKLGEVKLRAECIRCVQLSNGAGSCKGCGLR